MNKKLDSLGCLWSIGASDRTVSGPLTPDVPVSYIQNHTQVTILADRAAWSLEG